MAMDYPRDFRHSEGHYRPGPGTLYDDLKKMMDLGSVAVGLKRSRRAMKNNVFYTLTSDGRTALSAEIDRLQQIVRKAKSRLQYEDYDVFTPCISFDFSPSSTAFRDKFSNEMLWIFDEEHREKGAFRMLRDGMISLVRQHAEDDGDGPQSKIKGSKIVGSGIDPTRLVQVGLAAPILLLAVVFALEQVI